MVESDGSRAIRVERQGQKDRKGQGEREDSWEHMGLERELGW